MKNTDYLRCYLVLDADCCGTEKAMFAIAESLLESGITMIQLRMKHQPKRRIFEVAQRLKELLKGSDIPLIVNDHVDVALATDADGVHLGQEDLPPQTVRQMIGQKKWLGLSVSSEIELNLAPKDLIDYLGVGPVFETSSKKDASSPVGLVGLRELVSLAKPLPAVAIGGIGLMNLKAVLSTGVKGVALISAICKAPDPHEAVCQIVRTWKGSD